MNKQTLFNNLVSFINSVHNVTHELTKDAKSESISQVQYKILEYIAFNEPVTPSDINDCLNMALPNTSRELRKLSEKQLIEKVSHPQDRRKQTICLSKHGQALMNDALSTIESRFLKRIEHATEKELNDINQALAILQNKLFYD